VLHAHAHLIFLELIILIIFRGVKIKLGNFSCSFPHPSATSSLAGPDSLHSVLLSSTLFMKSSGFWDTEPWCLLEVSRRFGRIYHLYHQGWRVSEARNQHEAGSKQKTEFWWSKTTLCLYSSLDTRDLFSHPFRGRGNIIVFFNLHGVGWKQGPLDTAAT
jgi:hypothetical protein